MMMKKALAIAGFATLLSLSAQAQFGGVAVPGIGGGSGGSFGSTAKEYSVNVTTSMLNTVRGVEFAQRASGKKAEADRLGALAKEIEGMKQPKADVLERSMKAVDANPVDRNAITAVKSAEGKAMLAMATKHMMVAGVYNQRAVSSAKTLIGMKPGPTDVTSAPGLIDAAKLTAQHGPTIISNGGQYLSVLTSYLSSNGIKKPSNADCIEVAKKTDPDAASKGANF
jgi:hypothetical protein